MSLMSFENVVKVYPALRSALPGARRGAGRRLAVDDVTFSVGRGESYALVGESGCGKTTLARLGLALIRPTSGRVRFAGADVHRMRARELFAFRRRVQMVFQDPVGALDPRQRVWSAVEEPLILHGKGPPRRRLEQVARLLEVVGLSAEEGRRLPHQLSGGQRQRVVIARALALDPDLLFLDEPVSSLDVSVRAQILNLLCRIRRERGLGLVIISHDLGVVRHVADRVGVMHAGRLVEEGPAGGVLASPAHPYTQALLEAVPVPDPGARRPPPAQPPPEPVDPARGPSRGCLYAPLCPRAQGRCFSRRPPLRPLPGAAGTPPPPGAGPGRLHLVACHHPER